MRAFFQILHRSNTFLKEQSPYVHSFLEVLRKATVMMHGNALHTTLQMGVSRLKVLILIMPTVQWRITTPSESTLLSRICIDSLPGFWMPVMHSKILFVQISQQITHIQAYIRTQKCTRRYTEKYLHRTKWPIDRPTSTTADTVTASADAPIDAPA